MAPTLDASSPAAVYNDTAGTSSVVTASFTPPSGSIVVAKVTCGDAGTTCGTPTGLTFTSQINVGTASVSSRTAIFTATGAGSAVTVTVTFAGTSNVRGLVVEVWTSTALAGTPATGSAVAQSGAPSATVTTTGTGSVVAWVCSDWNGVSGASRAYRSSATETGYHLLLSNWTNYTAYQAAAAAGSQTIGLTAPSAGVVYTIAGIELQASGGAPAIPPIIVLAPRRP